MNKYIKIKVFNLQKGGASLAVEEENNKKLLVLCYAQRRGGSPPPYVKFFEDNIKNDSLNNYDVDLVGLQENIEKLDLYHANGFYGILE